MPIPPVAGQDSAASVVLPLLVHWATHGHSRGDIPEAFRRFYVSDSSGQPRLDLARVVAFRRARSKLTQLLLTLAHTLAGLPPRTTEVLTGTTHNTNHQERAIYLHEQQIMRVLRYDKARNLSANQPVSIGFLPDSVTRLVLYEWVYLRPLEA